jgi:hypothetical protein
MFRKKHQKLSERNFLWLLWNVLTSTCHEVDILFLLCCWTMREVWRRSKNAWRRSRKLMFPVVFNLDRIYAREHGESISPEETRTNGFSNFFLSVTSNWASKNQFSFELPIINFVAKSNNFLESISQLLASEFSLQFNEFFDNNFFYFPGTYTILLTMFIWHLTPQSAFPSLFKSSLTPSLKTQKHSGNNSFQSETTSTFLKLHKSIIFKPTDSEKAV